MQVYSGCDWRASSVKWLKAVGFGQMRTTPHWQPPVKGLPWVLDNGAFSLYRRATRERYDTTMGIRFTWILERIEAGRYPPIDFAILPDIVARSDSSLALSLRWLERFPSNVPPYLAVQDGMLLHGIRRVMKREPRIKGLFVGGTLEWKDRTAGAWATLAHDLGLKCHVGRVGTGPRIAAMLEAGIDSIDSTSWAQHYSHWHIRDGFEIYAKSSGSVPEVLRRMRRLPLPGPKEHP